MGLARRVGAILGVALVTAALLTHLTYSLLIPNPFLDLLPGGAFFLLVWSFLTAVGVMALD